MGYYKFDEVDVEKYMIKHGFFHEEAKLSVNEIGTGNMNYVFQVFDIESGKKLILKQAVPYARSVGESFPMSLDRMKIEAGALELQNKFAMGTVPKLYHSDEEMALIVMEDLSDFEVLRKGMIGMKKYRGIDEDISSFMANLAFYTSNLYLDSEKKRRLAKEFANENLIKITEDVIFTDPFYRCKRNRINPELLSYVEKKFLPDKNMQLEVAKLRYNFMTEAQSLVHGDLHTGSIFVKNSTAKIFDSEFSFYGPSAFDIGLLSAHFILNYISWSGKELEGKKIQDYRDYLLETLVSIYDKFFEKFSSLWNREGVNIGADIVGYKRYYLEKLFTDALGYAGIVIARRILGLTHVEDIDGIKNLKNRAKVQEQGLEITKMLLKYRHKFKDIDEVVGTIKAVVR